MRKIKQKLFRLKYFIILTFAIKFKQWTIITNNQKHIGKTNLIYDLAFKYKLPVLTHWEDLYRGLNTISPTDSLQRIMSFENRVILLDIIQCQTTLEVIYLLSQRGNILIGFESDIDFNRKD